MNYCDDFVCVRFGSCIYADDCENCLYTHRIEVQCPACKFEKLCPYRSKGRLKSSGRSDEILIRK